MAGQSGAAAGATAGAAFGPWGAVIGGAAGLIGDVASSGQGGPFLGGASDANQRGTAFDSSGWVINFGDGNTSTSTPTRITDSGLPGDAYGQALGGMSPLLLYGLGAVALFLLVRTLRKK